MHVGRILLVALSLGLAPGMAHAASSAWYDTEGGRIRLIVEDAPLPDGTIRGALSIDLKDGWKTYWKDPGDAGIPPQIDTAPSTNISGATIGFPAPERFETGDMHWAGYKGPVDLPVTFKVGDPALYAAIDIDVFLGVCEEICIPVQARLSVTPDPQGSSSVDMARVEAAFARLPDAATQDFAVTNFQVSDDRIVASASLPKDAGAAALFVVTPQGWKFGAPEPGESASQFIIPVLERPAAGSPRPTIAYTLSTDLGAVDGAAAVE